MSDAKVWRCFHCDEVFDGSTMLGQIRARDHFGHDPKAEPACQIKAGEERGILMRLRRTELALKNAKQDYSDLLDILEAVNYQCAIPADARAFVDAALADRT